MKNQNKILAAGHRPRLQKLLLVAMALTCGNLDVELDRHHHVDTIGFTQRAEARGGARVARGVGVGIGVGVGAGGVARRTARRVSRRWAVGTRLYSLPSDCQWSGGNWYCAEDGVYFQQINENNTVVYVSL